MGRAEIFRQSQAISPPSSVRGTPALSPARVRRNIIYSAPTVQLGFQNFHSITMSWRDNNKSYQILTAAEKGTYGVLAAIMYEAPAP